MAVILFYSPFNQRSRDTESLMIAFRKQKHRVISLTQQEGFIINDFLSAHDIETHSKVLSGKRKGWWYFVRHIFFFIYFCWAKRIDIVYSHLEPANFVASIGQYFIRAKTYLCRHHVDEGSLYQFDQDLYYKVTYRLAKKIIVVSRHAMEYMISKEKILLAKIVHINLAYDFSLYDSPDKDLAGKIKQKYKADVTLLFVSRLTKFKRPELAIKVLESLVKQGINAQLIMLGKGEMNESLNELIAKSELTQRAHLLGYVSNVLDYMTASDYLLHPSLLDSSCVVVKEAGLTRLPVIVCKGIGDFNDFLVNDVNGFLVEKDNFVNEASDIIIRNINKTGILRASMGVELNKAVYDSFSIENVIEKYKELNN